MLYEKETPPAHPSMQSLIDDFVCSTQSPDSKAAELIRRLTEHVPVSDSSSEEDFSMGPGSLCSGAQSGKHENHPKGNQSTSLCSSKELASLFTELIKNQGNFRACPRICVFQTSLQSIFSKRKEGHLNPSSKYARRLERLPALVFCLSQVGTTRNK